MQSLENIDIWSNYVFVTLYIPGFPPLFDTHLYKFSSYCSLQLSFFQLLYFYEDLQEKAQIIRQQK